MSNGGPKAPGWPQPQPQPQQDSFDRQVANAFGALGNAFGQAAAAITLGVGSRVLVQWSDGRRYPGTVSQMGNGHVHVTFPDGQAHWIPAAYVTPA